jgi:flagellar basal-body rod protein FlgC
MVKLMIKLSVIIILFPMGIYSQTLSDAMAINMSGIIAQRLKMTIIAENVANLMTLKDEETGLPYQKKYISLEASEMGVKILGVERSTEPFGRYFDPAVPQADENGYFYLPNVSMPHEMITLKHTESMFDANINAFKLSKAMYQTAIELLK